MLLSRLRCPCGCKREALRAERHIGWSLRFHSVAGLAALLFAGVLGSAGFWLLHHEMTPGLELWTGAAGATFVAATLFGDAGARRDSHIRAIHTQRPDQADRRGAVQPQSPAEAFGDYRVGGVWRRATRPRV